MNILKSIALAGLMTSTAFLGAGAAGAFQTAGPASNASSNQTAERMTEKMPIDMRGFIDMAASGGLFEVASSKLALERGVGGEVKSFAEQMIGDHNKANAELMAIAARLDPPMSVPTELNGKHRAMLQAINEAGANNPSRAYVDAQRAAHNEAVALFTAYAANGDNAQLQAFASRQLPTLRAHLDHIRRIEAKR